MNAALLYLLTTLVALGALGREGVNAQSLAERSFTFVPVPIGTKTQVSCRAITSVNINQLRAGVIDREKLTASIDSGTDRLSIRIAPDHLIFLSSASFGSGSVEGAKFPLIENTVDYLKAFESRHFGVALLESFVLNKHTGLAIWTKVQAKGLVAEVPESQTIYLACI